MAFELVATIETTLDEDGYFSDDIFKDLGKDGKQPSERSFYYEVYYEDNPQVVVATSNTLVIKHTKPDPVEEEPEEEEEKEKDPAKEEGSEDEDNNQTP